jgi:hypothetical protein
VEEAVVDNPNKGAADNPNKRGVKGALKVLDHNRNHQ